MEPVWHQWLEMFPISLCCSKVTMCCHGEGNLLNMESLYGPKASVFCGKSCCEMQVIFYLVNRATFWSSSLWKIRFPKFSKLHLHTLTTHPTAQFIWSILRPLGLHSKMGTAMSPVPLWIPTEPNSNLHFSQLVLCMYVIQMYLTGHQALFTHDPLLWCCILF